MFFGNEIEAIERITGKRVRTLCYDPLKSVYEVNLENDFKVEEVKISKRLVEKEVEKIKSLNISLDGLGGE